ncbi:DUF3310 domain-containing protein [Streptomyces buecherae]|uniref:DUF3310 domain-containing protein n=1 Tax=Streptomyces buecherae TaxID=2763006 RepID=UPI0037ADC77B
MSVNEEAGAWYPYGVQFEGRKGGLIYVSEHEIEEVPVTVDSVEFPPHYQLGDGRQAIDIAELLNYNRGNAIKYLVRAGRKGGEGAELEDLRKAAWYVAREINRISGGQSSDDHG